MRPPLAQCWMWCRSVRRDSQPGNRHRQPSRSRAARRIAELGRRRRRPRARISPRVAVGHPRQGGGAGEHLRGGHADRRAVLDVAPGRVGRVTGDPGRGCRRFRGNAGGGSRGGGSGEDIGAGVHHDLVDLRVVGPGYLPGQERLGDGDQAVGQVRRGPDSRRACGRLASGRRVRGGRCRGSRRFRGNVRARITRQVGAGSPQRRQQYRALQGRQPERAGQRPVLLHPPGQPAADPGTGVVRPGDLAVRPGEPLQLVRGHRPGQPGQPRLGRRGRDPGQRPHLGIRQPPGGEPGPDHRQVPQRPRHPDMLPRRTGRQLALPRQPLRAGTHLPAGPAPPGVEIAQQDQEPARRRGQVPGQLADLRLHPLQRHPGRLSRRRGHVSRRRDGGEDRA